MALLGEYDPYARLALKASRFVTPYVSPTASGISGAASGLYGLAKAVESEGDPTGRALGGLTSGMSGLKGLSQIPALELGELGRFAGAAAPVAGLASNIYGLTQNPKDPGAIIGTGLSGLQAYEGLSSLAGAGGTGLGAAAGTAGAFAAPALALTNMLMNPEAGGSEIGRQTAISAPILTASVMSGMTNPIGLAAIPLLMAIAIGSEALASKENKFIQRELGRKADASVGEAQRQALERLGPAQNLDLRSMNPEQLQNLATNLYSPQTISAGDWSGKGDPGIGTPRYDQERYFSQTRFGGEFPGTGNPAAYGGQAESTLKDWYTKEAASLNRLQDVFAEAQRRGIELKPPEGFDLSRPEGKGFGYDTWQDAVIGEAATYLGSRMRQMGIPEEQGLRSVDAYAAKASQAEARRQQYDQEQWFVDTFAGSAAGNPLARDPSWMIDRAYQRYLGRKPSEEEKGAWWNAPGARGNTVSRLYDVLRGIEASPEAQARR